MLAGDTATHDRILSESLTRLVEEVDVVVLAQASMARMVQTLPLEVRRIPMLSSPELAVRSALAALCPEDASATV